jgi:hypothetical protein
MVYAFFITSGSLRFYLEHKEQEQGQDKLKVSIDYQMERFLGKMAG